MTSTGMPADAVLWPLLQELVACLCAEVNEKGGLCFCGVWPGVQPPRDLVGQCEDGDCGAAYVMMPQAFPSQDFPAPDAQGTCSTLLAAQLTVGVVRCYPLASEDGGPPEAAKIQEWAEWQMADMAAIRRAISCCFGGKFDDLEYVLGTYRPVPPQGGTAGGEWTVTVQQVF